MRTFIVLAGPLDLSEKEKKKISRSRDDKNANIVKWDNLRGANFTV